MIGAAGRSVLTLGVPLSVVGTLLWLRSALTGGSPRSARLARVLSWMTFGAACGAAGLLETCLLTHDFGVRYVAENGGRGVPVYYTVTSMWAAQDGSLLLWLLILTGYGVLLARSATTRSGGGAARAHPWAMVVVGVVTVFFFALSTFAANPFAPVHPVPLGGPGPNPLLRSHPAVGVHPPLLYAGYVGMVVPFAYGVAGLITGESGRGWLRTTRRWMLLSWSLLTAGIALGAWWSYAVLGWGGYWSWDPVENASLLPWLTATALLHVAMVRRGRGLPGWAVALATASFVLVLAGTFLTRSGAVASVHAFARSPVGPTLLGFVLLVATGVAALSVWRGHLLSPAPSGIGVTAPDRLLLTGVVSLVTLTAVVLTGTLFPLLSQALTGQRSGVDTAYFDRTAVPISLAAMVFAGAAMMTGRRGDMLSTVAGRLFVPTGAGLAAVAVVGFLTHAGPMALAAFGAAAFLLASVCRCRPAARRTSVDSRTGASGRSWRTLSRRVSSRGARTAGQPVPNPHLPPPAPGSPRSPRYAALLAHAGVAVMAVGVAGSSTYTSAVERELRVGQAISVHGVTARLSRVDRHGDTNGMTVTAPLRLTRDDHDLGTVRPRMRYFPDRDMTVSLPGIRARLASDVYATVTEVAEDGASATVRLAVNPLVGLVWLGCALMTLGGLVALGRRATTRPGSATVDRDDTVTGEPVPDPPVPLSGVR